MIAVLILNEAADKLPVRSIARDIAGNAQLYLQGNLTPGGTVAAWWKRKDQQEARCLPA